MQTRLIKTNRRFGRHSSQIRIRLTIYPNKYYVSISKIFDPKVTTLPSSFCYLAIIFNFNDGRFDFVLFSIPAISIYGGIDFAVAWDNCSLYDRYFWVSLERRQIYLVVRVVCTCRSGGRDNPYYFVFYHFEFKLYNHTLPNLTA